MTIQPKHSLHQQPWLLWDWHMQPTQPLLLLLLLLLLCKAV